MRQLLMQGEAEEAIKHCRRQIERVRAEVERLQQAGQDATRAQERLRTLQQILVEHEANRDRLAPKEPWIGKPITQDH
jgi:DNA repair exonuclease SbcCD ATPase subunit